MIACVDLHNDHNVYVYKTGSAELQLVGKQKGDQNKIHDIAFSQKDGCTRFATAGSKHMYFWDAAQNGFDKKKGIYDGAPMTSFSCATWDADGNVYTGGANSLVYCWNAEERKCTGTIKAHSRGFICAIKYVDGKLWSGGKDGNVHCIDLATKESTKCIEFGHLVRAVDCMDGNLLVGLRDGTIWHRPCDGGEGKAIMASHNDGEVWGLASCEGKVFTSGDDNQCIIWDPVKRAKESGFKITDDDRKPKRGRASTLSHYPASQQSRAVASGANYVAVARNDGYVQVYAKGSYDSPIQTLTDSDEWIECMAFSPDQTMFAVGSHDNRIYVYSTADGKFTLQGTCKGHSSYIMALDWCKESKYLRTNCGAYELLFWTAADGNQDPSGRSNTTGTAWATETVKFSWLTEGIYPKGTDGTHINAVTASHDNALLACGDDYGLVTLFRNPARKGAQPRAYRAHSEHVTGVMFAEDDGYIWSTGGYDQTVMQWKRC